MNKKALENIQDYWAWRAEVELDDNYDNPTEEDMPRYYPCSVAWHRMYEHTSIKNSIVYIFIYMQDILGL